jgi:hypothetical protein
MSTTFDMSTTSISSIPQKEAVKRIESGTISSCGLAQIDRFSVSEFRTSYIHESKIKEALSTLL